MEYYDILIDERVIDNYFTVYIPEDTQGKLKCVKTSNPQEYGIKVGNDTLNKFFSHFNIPLHEKYLSIFHYEDWSFEQEVRELLNSDNHIICGFSYGALYNEQKNIDIGHVSIIADMDDNQIKLLDPGPINPGLKYVKADDLYSAIKMRRDGLWLISLS
jgi:hypothetical protein